jgi:hypothetical protein
VTVRELSSLGAPRTVGTAAASVTCVTLCPDGVTGMAGSVEGRLMRFHLDRPERYRAFEDRLSRAREALQRDRRDPAGLLAFGQWFAFRGLHGWAADLLAEARDLGADVPAIELARCYWQLGRHDDAARELRAALARREAPPEYLTLCLDAVTHPPTTRP